MRILLVDDDPLVRTGLKAVLQSEKTWAVVGEAGDGAEAIRMVTDLSPDLVIMDIRMPGLDGLEATERITSMKDPPRVLVLTTFEIDEYVFEALRSGAAGFVLKRVPPAELIEVVRIVATGESLVFPQQTRALISRFASATNQRDKNLAELTDRETDVLRLLARGRSNQEISDELYIGIETVKTHIRSILLKLGAKNRTQAVIIAYESGFVAPGEHTDD
jgi:DNA-binding NarL/FixJ family response regulator